MNVVKTTLNVEQVRRWVRGLVQIGSWVPAEADVLLARPLMPGDILVYSDWVEGRVEVTIEWTK